MIRVGDHSLGAIPRPDNFSIADHPDIANHKVVYER